ASSTVTVQALPLAGVLLPSLAMGNRYTCSLQAGQPYCWGQDAVTMTVTRRPRLVAGTPTLLQITSGGGSTCGVTASGAGWCWGDNTYGALGNGTLTSSAQPTQVVATDGVSWATIRAGRRAYGITTTGALYWWGLGDD